MNDKATSGSLRDGCPISATDGPRSPENRCAVCLDMFRRNLQQVELLLAEMDQERIDGQQVITDLKATFRSVLLDAVPLDPPEPAPDRAEGFHDGWQHCREDVSRRVETLLSVLE